MHDLLNNTAHRPWPLPHAPWMLGMRWLDLLFMHWPVPLAALRPHVPPRLQIETFHGSAWIGVVPFRMRDVRPHGLPSVPLLSHFPELNVRTYVSDGQHAGVWFFSLDAANLLAVRLARQGFFLNYLDARMVTEPFGGDLIYASERTHTGAPPATLRVRYRPSGAPFRAAPGTLEHWLTERYCLYAADPHGQIWRGDIHHAPWPLQPAVADVLDNTMTVQIGLTLPDIPPLLHFAAHLDVIAWLPERTAPA